MSSHLEDSCIFCEIVKGTVPSFKILETEHSLAFLDIHPVSEGHTLIIPKYHAEKILDLPDEYLSDIGPLLKKVAVATGAEQFNVLQVIFVRNNYVILIKLLSFQNNGELAFQHVRHVHFHVVPKPSATEGMVITLEDNWPVRSVNREELVKTAEKMKARLE
ncbi:HIT-like domain-containing protein [Flammula alnicola]|nr:HIT-like domain-containing protein [Flammula alnicola]